MKDWEVIQVLHETRNITRAARRLFMTQPALSLRLKSIEQYFSAPLVLRNNKGIQFTEAGEYLAAEARKILNDLTRIHDTLNDMRTTVSGSIRIGATNYATRYFLPLILKNFRATHPLVEFRISSGVSMDVISMVNNNDVHVGLVRADVPWSGDKSLLFTEKVLVVNAEPFRLKDLPAMPLIHYQIAPYNQERIDKWWDEHFDRPPSMPMMVARADTCHELIAQGFGYGFLPSSILAGQSPLTCRPMRFANGSLVERKVWAIAHKETRRLRLVDEFWRAITAMDYSVLAGDNASEKRRAGGKKNKQ